MKKERFLFHAVILAVAGFASRVIGLLYAIPLYHIIGEEGNGYYGTAYEIYNMLLLITAFSMPMAISKIMSVYVAEKDYVNCKRLFRVCLLYVFIVGGAGAIITYVFADSFVVAPAVLSLKVMAPTIFFSGILSVLRGFTQAHNTMVPTALSQIVEQIFNAVFSILLAFVLMKLATEGGGRGILEMLGVTAGSEEMGIPPTAFGAMGSSLGTLVGVLIALIFMIIYIMSTRKTRLKLYAQEPASQLQQSPPTTIVTTTTHSATAASTITTSATTTTPPAETPPTPEPYFTLFRVIFMYASPIILTSFIYNISTTIDMKIFWDWATKNDYSQETAASIFGIYSRQYLVLINVPITIASAISSSMIPGLSVDFSANEVEAVKTRISKSVRTVVLFAVPAVVGLMVLAKPIMQLLFTGTSKAASDALIMGSVSVLFFSVATVLNSGLQAMGKSFLAIRNVSYALIIHILYVVGMLNISGSIMGILVSGSVLYSMAMCFGNINSLEKFFGCKLNVIGLVGKPVMASLIMGVVAALAISVLNSLGLGNLLSVLITIALSIGVYFTIFYFKNDYMDRSIFARSRKRT